VSSVKVILRSLVQFVGWLVLTLHLTSRCQLYEDDFTFLYWRVWIFCDLSTGYSELKTELTDYLKKFAQNGKVSEPHEHMVCLCYVYVSLVERGSCNGLLCLWL